MTFMSVILFYRRDKTDIILVQRRNRRNGCNKTTLRLLEQNLQPSKKFYLENLLKGKKKKRNMSQRDTQGLKAGNKAIKT